MTLGFITTGAHTERHRWSPQTQSVKRCHTCISQTFHVAHRSILSRTPTRGSTVVFPHGRERGQRIYPKSTRVRLTCARDTPPAARFMSSETLTVHIEKSIARRRRITSTRQGISDLPVTIIMQFCTQRNDLWLQLKVASQSWPKNTPSLTQGA